MVDGRSTGINWCSPIASSGPILCVGLVCRAVVVRSHDRTLSRSDSDSYLVVFFHNWWVARSDVSFGRGLVAPRL